MPYPSSIGFTEVKNTACLPLLKLFPPGINPFLIMKFNSLAVVDVLGKILSVTVHCLATQDQ